ncbi:MAG: FtsW/RodA/SpoVE family cell cycle protein [Planctomycetota bacterium]
MNALLAWLSDVFRPHAGWYALAAALALTAMGVAAIDTVSPYYASKQTQWVPLALIVMVLFMLPSARLLGAIAYPGFVFCLILLVFVILPFVPRGLVPRINGATSWINLGLMNFQPSEAARVFFVLSLAWYLRFRENHRTLLGLLVPFGIMLVPVLLILKQPDLGVALVFGPTLLVMLIAAGAKLWHLGSIVALGVLAIGVNVAIVFYAPPDLQLLKPHQQMRIKSMVSLAMDDDRYVQDAAYQQDKAMTLIGAGGVSGYGRDAAETIVRYNRLPERHNDMIFAVIVNRWGLLGAWAMMGMYLLLVMSMLTVAARSKDPLARLSCVGFASMILTPATINIGMCLGVMPITGITLPFVSYGGSSLLFSFAIVGLVMNFASRKPRAMARPSFEFDHADAIYQ